MKEVSTKGAERNRGDHEGEIRDVHAKIGELPVERDFLGKGLKGGVRTKNPDVCSYMCMYP